MDIVMTKNRNKIQPSKILGTVLAIGVSFVTFSPKAWSEAPVKTAPVASVKDKTKNAPASKPVDQKSKLEKDMVEILGEFVTVPGGTFIMGSPDSEAGRLPIETQHKVTLSPFNMQVAMVTQEEYAKIMGTNPSNFKDPKYCKENFKELEVDGKKIPMCSNHPVEMVTYEDVTEFLKKVNEKFKDSGWIFELASEAQQEYALRGGTTTAFVSGDTAEGSTDLIWNEENSGGQTHPIKGKQANKYGIYRESVASWCKDWYGEYPTTEVTDPVGPAEGKMRIIRGCSWKGKQRRCRTAQRNGYAPTYKGPNVGFRVIRVAASK
jgi:formylglycine-generating enzyme required for sulfatase activity